MPRTIGIVGCSAEGAALCYQTICRKGVRFAGPHYHPVVVMHTHPLGAYLESIDRNEWNGVAALMVDSARRLEDAGADFLISPDNTIHRVFNEVVTKTNLPWIHIVDSVVQAARTRGFVRIAVLGTQFLMNSQVYPERLEPQGMTFMPPSEIEQQIVNSLIFDELVKGIVSADSRERLKQIIASMAARGAQACALACTELPLLIDESSSPLPLLDSTRLLAESALQEAYRE